MSHKGLAVGGLAVFVSFVVAAAVLGTSYTVLSTLQGINPVAALIAFTVAFVGMAMFKKSRR